MAERAATGGTQKLDMSEMVCPACGQARLGNPGQFAGVWYVGCSACHTETPVALAPGASASAPQFRILHNPSDARGAATYRRRTPF